MVDLSFSSRAIDLLTQRLRDVRDARLRRQLQVQLAGVLARLARTEEARQIVEQLRKENETYEPRLSSWIMYTEGLIAHFESLDVIRAKDRFRRAYAIALASDDRELLSIAAAWMADSEFRTDNTTSALSYLQIAFSRSEPSEHEARGRACLILADLLSWSGMFDEAKTWYQRARGHAVSLGDIGMQSALLFNSASFRVGALVLRDCFAPTSPDSATSLSREVTSVSNLDAGLGIRTLTTLIPALEAELKTIQRSWGEAISGFDNFLARIEQDGQSRLKATFHAHRAWCFSNIGRSEEAMRDVDSALREVAQCKDFDDLAVVHARLHAVYRQQGMTVQANDHLAMARRCLGAFEDMQRSLGMSLAAILEGISVAQRESPA